MSLLFYAREFLECGHAADGLHGGRQGYEVHAPIPAIYMLGHSIELSLKAFLIERGVPVKCLSKKPFGHDLLYCYGQVVQLGFDARCLLNARDLNTLTVLNKLYRAKKLEYFYSGQKQLPIYGELERIAVHFYAAMCRHFDTDYDLSYHVAGVRV